MTPLEHGALFTAWSPTPFGSVIVATVAGWYLWQVRRARREHLAWAWWRVVLYLVVGVGTLAYATIGPLATYRSHVFWIGALQVGTLASLTPVGLALGDPVSLLRRLHPEHPDPVVRFLEGRVARVLMFPAVSTVLAVCTVLAVFFTPAFVTSTRSAIVEAALDVVLVTTGLLFVLPLMVDELLPAWATPGVRTLLAFVDGLLDAVPGILIMTASTVVVPGFPGFAGRLGQPDPLLDTHLGGGALIAVAESVGLPIIGVVFMEWMRSDEREADAIDAQFVELDASPRADAPDPSGLWWESDPRFAGRHHRPADRPPTRGTPGVQ